MTELRFDATTGEWVVMASERARRPHDFASHRKVGSSPDYERDCPFCPGNENLTPPEVAAYIDESNSMHWMIRVVPNKFPALSPVGVAEKKKLVNGYFWVMDGFGFNEVVIETPHHNWTLYGMKVNEVEPVIRMYRDRYNALIQDRRIRMIVIFKNHGLSSGASLVHPHSQIVAAPMVSQYAKRKCGLAREHFLRTGRCLHCDINELETQSKSRVVHENDAFLVFHPFASHYPFETWISPKKHSSCFDEIDLTETHELAEAICVTFGKIGATLGQLDFNLVFNLPPAENACKDYLHWYVQIVPRTWTDGGFEMGSGIRINASVPEETAKFLREKKVSLD